MNRFTFFFAASFLPVFLSPVLAQDLTNSGIENKKDQLGQYLQKRLEQINQEFSELQIFEAKMKDARINFERKMTEEEKAYLDTLKAMPNEGRKAAFQEFSKKQENARRKFYEEQKNRRREFQKMREEGTMKLPPSPPKKSN